MLKWCMLLLYILLICYLLWRMIHLVRRVHPLLDNKFILIPMCVIFNLVCATLLASGLLPFGPVRTLMRRFSNYWLALFLYLFVFTFLADILVMITKLIDRKIEIPLLRKQRGYALVGILVVSLTVSFTVYGIFHAKKIYTNSYEVSIDKSFGNRDSLNVVLIGDLHLGYSVGCEDMEKMVNIINGLNPDIVVIAGDIYDNDYDALDDPDQLAEILSGLKSTYGTYAVYGNHDVDETLIGGFPIGSGKDAYRDPRLVTFVENCGFHMLEDDVTLIDDSFYLIGRVDEERAGDGTKNRESIEELTEGLDTSKPCFVLTHEPSELQETADCGVDALFNGHTHAGQFFPLTIAQPIRWKNYWGYLQVDQMHNFVTSGVGVYGPDVRVGTDSEVMQIIIDGQ